MDISPKLLREVEFREQWRGYNPEEVDDFLERLALGLEELQARLTDALERASTAERRLADNADADEIRRTLVLAQRTASATVDEARADADRLVQETEARCRQLVADAESQAGALEQEIAERRREELGGLAEERSRLQAEVDELGRFAEEQRARVVAALRELDAGLVLRTPPVSDVPVVAAPEPVAAPAAAAVDIEGGADVEVDGPDEHDELVEPEEPFVVDVDDASAASGDLADARADLEAALERAGVDDGPSVFDDAADDTGQFDLLADGDDETGDEPAQPAWRDEHDDDPFLAELRKAVVDDGPLGPRDDDPSSAHHVHDDADGDDDGLSSGGFFRRGRRRT
jgi:cell division initiation protein